MKSVLARGERDVREELKEGGEGGKRNLNS